MAYYNDPFRRTAIPQGQTGTPVPGTGQYIQAPGSTALGSQGVGFPGGANNSFSGVPRTATLPVHAMAGQPYMQQQPQYMPQAVPQTAAAYGTSPAAQYMAATQAAATQQAGLGGQNPYAAAHPGMGGAGVPLPGAYNAGAAAPGAQSFPGASGQYYGGHEGHGDLLPPQQHHRRHSQKKKKSHIRKIVEELLAGGAGLAAAHHEEKKHSRSRANSSSQPNPPNVAQPPKGAAPGYLHPKGHFVPGAIDDLANHFLHKRGDMAPENSQPGYLHPGGHFVPLAIGALVPAFAHTLSNEHRRHRGPTERKHQGTRGGSNASSSGSDYSDSDSGSSSGSDEDYGQQSSGSARK